ncbi:serine/threonine protein kinase [Corallococcus coralloides DSM 2259]|uniref:Serine/threonine protein kinase n=1 Tax=Corallococcus coralloides (strain ATCC 25202 / DSM 2259 / NBRC 100086 / M2) TaxID=1144275 RepID=H8MMC6_CORCM|nr:serine/threonine-protein kinase [Corallococcus coralloides]AFE09339.1 serine/threonine protein kinase [Corallococcus coralloides DSM 2259]
MPPPSAGFQFGKYKLLERIATGGMAEIYRARMTAVAGVTKPVVIKKILPGYADDSAFVSMFINEARIALGLSHGNIAQIFDFGEVEGEYFLAMEWVDGHPLSHVLRRAREKGLPALPPPLAVLVAIDMLRGLAYAHTRLDDNGRPLHIVHRDVSPQNVLLSFEGQVKLVDFGIARARLAGRSDTKVDPAKGKYVYFAPEQARGEALDARTDVFAAGTVLYEMLCGRRPFEGSLQDVLRKISQGDFPRPREWTPNIPAALERILLTAMATSPEQRYPTAQAFAEALARQLHVTAPDVSTSDLGHFMGYLFEPELVEAGRPVQLPREFIARVGRWSGIAEPPPIATPPEVPRHVSEPGGEPREPRGDLTTQPLPPQAMPPEPRPAWHRSLRGWAVRGAPVVVAALVATWLGLVMGGSSTFAVELSSSPPGATIRVDGRTLTETTPTLITQLASDRDHVLEVLLPGMVPFSQRVQAERGTTLAVHARLAPKQAVAARALPRAGPDDAPAAIARYSAGGPFALSAVAHALRVPSSQAARMRLDPSRTYGLRVEGRVSVGGPLPVAQAVYFLEGGTALAARDSFGLVGADEVLVRDASVLYVFLWDDRPDDNRGALQVHVREQASGAITTLLLDARRHAVSLSPHDGFTLRELDPSTTYRVVVRLAGEPARTRGFGGGEVGGVLALHGAGLSPAVAPGTLEVLEVNQPTVMRGASWLRLAFPDDDVHDNSGGLTLEVTPVAPLHQ